jgi:hypothetical protein
VAAAGLTALARSETSRTTPRPATATPDG